ncbi:MAG: murein biosynthesis integral membrane protein MurJ [Opitutales bacterium]
MNAIKKVNHIAIVSFATLGSRVLGLVRDVLIFSFFGVSAINSAFIFAFTLPNLFRRLLGEGALTSAVMPVMAGELEGEGKEAAFSFLNRVISRLFFVLLGLVILAIVLLQCVSLWPGLEERWYLGARLASWLMPFMLLICLAAMFSAALNLLERFAVPALSPVWLNLSMMLGLGVFGYFLGKTALEQVYYLCAGVLVGGVIQCILPAWALKQEGWKPRMDFSRCERVQEMLGLLMPGLAGAAVFQVNIVVSRLLAFSLDTSAVSILYLASRLIELPLGVFTIAITTVVFPGMSKLAARGLNDDFAEEYAHGMRLILAITVPAAAGLVVLAEPILKILFEWGAFSAQDVKLTQPVLVISSVGLPFYSMATLATRAFHALKDTKTPVIIAYISFAVNLALSLWWMQVWGVAGLAAASVAAALLQNIVLRIALVRKNPRVAQGRFWFSLLEVVAAAKIMAIIAWLAFDYIQSIWGAGKLGDMLAIIFIIPLAMIFYILFLKLFRFEEAYEIRDLLLGVIWPFKKKPHSA